jgi:hypothetical protein
MSLEDVPRCQHVKVNGTQCGSPALRRRRLCFFHDKVRRERARIAADSSAQRRFNLPLLEDANSVQLALMKVIQMLGSGQLDHKTAGLMLYALQTASINLRNTDFEVDEVTDIVIDRDTVQATCINGPQWFEDDFEENDDEEEVEEDDDVEAGTIEDEQGDDQTEARDEAPAASLQAKAKTAGKPEPDNQTRQLASEPSRKQVKKLPGSWPAQAVAQKTQ